MNFKDLSDSLINSLKGRITNPFFSSLIISWILINWEIVIYLFTNYPIDDKVTHIKSLGENSWSIFWYPLIAATIVIIVYPLIGNLSHWLYQYYRRMRKNVDIHINKEAYLPLDEAKELRDLVEKKTNEFNEFYDQKNKVIDQLKSNLNKSQSKIQEITVDKDNYYTLYTNEGNKNKELQLKYNKLEIEDLVLTENVLALINYHYFGISSDQLIGEDFKNHRNSLLNKLTMDQNNEVFQLIDLMFNPIVDIYKKRLKKILDSQDIDFANKLISFEKTDVHQYSEHDVRFSTHDVTELLLDNYIFMKDGNTYVLTNLGVLYIEMLKTDEAFSQYLQP